MQEFLKVIFFAAFVANSLYILMPSTMEYAKAIMVVSGKSSLVKYCLSCPAVLSVVYIPLSSNAFGTFTADIGGLNSILCGGFTITSSSCGTDSSSVST
jgi:hypothetical protein